MNMLLNAGIMYIRHLTTKQTTYVIHLHVLIKSDLLQKNSDQKRAGWKIKEKGVSVSMAHSRPLHDQTNTAALKSTPLLHLSHFSHARYEKVNLLSVFKSDIIFNRLHIL